MKRKKIKSKINPLVISSVVLFLLLLVSILTSGFGIKDKFSKVSKEEIAEKTIDFVNKNFLSNGLTASLVSISLDENGLYKVKLKVQDQEFDSYVSRDGNILFPQGIEMKAQIGADQAQEQEQEEIPKRDISDVKLFVMSFCPYGNLAEDIMMPVVNLLKDKADIKLHYIVSKDSDGSYQSLHGDEELSQDVREICVQKHQKEKFWEFIKEINENTTHQDVEKKWEGIAKSIGIDVSKIKECQKNEASILLDREIRLTDKYRVSGSPTLIINEVIYQGDRTSDAYKQAICSGFKVPPKECSTKLSDVANDTSTGGCE